MKKGILLLILCLATHLLFAQSGSAPDRGRDAGGRDYDAPAQIDRLILPAQVPPAYLNTHCFVKNNSANPSYLSISNNNISWTEKTIAAGGSLDIPVTDSVYLKIYSSNTVSFTLKALPARYYTIKYDAAATKWIIE